MGSCEDLFDPVEPIDSPAGEEPSCSGLTRNCGSELLPCSKIGRDLIESDVGGHASALNGCVDSSGKDKADFVGSGDEIGNVVCLGSVELMECMITGARFEELSRNDNADCVGSVDGVGIVPVDGASGLGGEIENMVRLGPGELVDENCGVSGAGCLELSGNDYAACASSGDGVGTAPVDGALELGGQIENVVLLGSGELVEECEVSRACLNERQSEVELPSCSESIQHRGLEMLPCPKIGLVSIDSKVVCSDALNGSLELSWDDNADCVVSGDGMEITPVDVTKGLVGESENVVPSSISGKLLDKYGVRLTSCLDERQSGSVNSRVEPDRLCMEKVGSIHENNGFMKNSLEHIDKSLESSVASSILSNGVVEDEQKDNKRRHMAEKSDCFAAIGTREHDHMLPSPSCEKSTNLTSVNGSPAHGVEQDKQDSGTPLESAKEERSVDSDGLDINNPSQSLGHESQPELIPASVLNGNCFVQDDQKDGQTINCYPAEGVVEILEEKTDFLTGTTTSQGFEKLLESIPNTCSLVKIVAQDKEKDDEPASSPSEEGFRKVQSVILANVETVERQKILHYLDKEMSSESVFQQNELDAQTINVSLKEADLDRERDTISNKCIDRYTLMAPEGSEMPTELLQIVDEVSCCDQQIDVNSDKDVDFHSAERGTVTIERNSNIERCVQVLPSQACQRTFEDLTGDNSMSNCVQLCEHQRGDGMHLGRSFAESMLEVLEENRCGEVELCTKKLFVEGNAVDLKDGSPEIRPNCFDNKPFSPESCQPSIVDENGHSKNLHLFRKDVSNCIDITCAFECSGQTDHKVKDIDRVTCVSETKCHNSVSSSSQRSSQRSKSSRKTQTKRVARKCRNKARVADLHEVFETILRAPRWKRSFFSKRDRTSIWGSLVTEKFLKSNGLNFIQIQNQGSWNARVGRGSRKRTNKRVCGSSQKSNGKNQSSTTCLRLKIKVGKGFSQSCLNSNAPEVIEASASTDGVISGCKTELYQGNSVGDTSADMCHPNRDSEKTVISENSTGDVAEAGVGLLSHIEYNGLASAIEKRNMDPGTSPDSEVINLIPGDHVAATCEEEFPDSVLNPRCFAASGDATTGVRGKKKGRLLNTDNCFLKDRSSGATNIKKTKPTKKHGGRQRKDDDTCSSEILTSTIANVLSNSSNSKELSVEQSAFSGVSSNALPVQIGIEAKIHCTLDDDLHLSGSQNSKNMLPSMKSRVRQYQRKSGGASKKTYKVADVARSRKKNGCKRGNEHESVYENKIKEKIDCDHVVNKVEKDLERDDVGKIDTGENIASKGITDLDMASSISMEQNQIKKSILMEQCLPQDNAWVRCDDCHKWRRIPVALVDSIGQTNCQWICKDNLDKAFADCCTPQEKSNAEINAELGISDADEDACDFTSSDKGLGFMRAIVSKEHGFTRISTNQFLHRSRKTQTIDEIMVCHCQPPVNGGLGCGDECLNRMLNIECVQGTCPCGDLCSNQQFQKHSYAKMMWDRCGKKGFGLRLKEDISKGQFLIEYVGEVLDMHTYEARQKDYALNGHKHFYFMTLDGSEVIDACAKGNLGRFINHSCDPNCRTEKWVVNGEICIGLFALRDIKKGDEVTFDYNYVRVFGAAAKKCYCGSLQCRGYIGGDPTNSEVIDQVDSDEEFPEPVMLEEGDSRDDFENIISSSSYDGIKMQVAESISKDRDKMNNSRKAVGKFEVADSQSHISLEMDNLKGCFPSSDQPRVISLKAKDVASKTTNAAQQDISMEEILVKPSSPIHRPETSPTAILDKSSSEGIVISRQSKSTTAEDKRVFVKSRFLIKTPRQSSSVKKEKITVNSPNVNKAQIFANKSQVLCAKTKKLLEGAPNGRFEAVEEKLNELLDSGGGISKTKDAPKVYLKLLLLTAASGANRNGEAIQSNRDLSMILDALLKTKSGVVLIDIINKNGLQMLHNMIKQYRWDFKKIPILRKLLKVLEHLAFKKILTLEHINGGPPCPGMESFRESILSLTEHDDKQVHQIARSFRDRWIPRYVRKHNYMDRDDRWMEFHRGSNCTKAILSHSYGGNQSEKPADLVDCSMKSMEGTTVDPSIHENCSAPSVSGNTKTRKRKSRWDQPAPVSRTRQHSVQKIDSGLPQPPESDTLPEMGKVVLDHVEGGGFCLQDEAHSLDDGRQNINEDIPPGFTSPHNFNMMSSNASSTLSDLHQQSTSSPNYVDGVVGHPQKKFNNRLPVSYGIPLAVVQQFGSPNTGTKSWIIAPGLPFQPFPPLPPFPRHEKETQPSCTANSLAIDERSEGWQPESHAPAISHPNESNPNMIGANQPDTYAIGPNGQQIFKRARGSSYDLGRRYFRQQKCFPPPWVRKRNGWDT